MKKLDVEMKKTDLLLYQMIPKKIADQLRSGEKAASLCEVRFNSRQRTQAIVQRTDQSKERIDSKKEATSREQLTVILSLS